MIRFTVPLKKLDARCIEVFFFMWFLFWYLWCHQLYHLQLETGTILRYDCIFWGTWAWGMWNIGICRFDEKKRSCKEWITNRATSKQQETTSAKHEVCCQKSKLTIKRNGPAIPLMVQKSPVELGSSSHCLQGFIHSGAGFLPTEQSGQRFK